MNLRLFREKLGPLADTLKSEGDKLRAAHGEASAKYAATLRELRQLQDAPPHRSELEALFADALEQWNARCAEELSRLIGGWRTTPLQSRSDARQQAMENLLWQGAAGATPPILHLLAGAHCKAELAALVAELPWPDGPDPADRAAQIATLEKQADAHRDAITELSAIAEGAGIKLR